jgi:hypothetical protein
MRTAEQSNFTGVWRMDPRRSVLRSPSPTALRMKIAHDGATLAQAVLIRHADASERRSRFDYEIGGSTTNHIGGRAVTTRAAWRGSTLVIESALESPNGPLRLADHWTLSDDGRTLVMAHPDDALAGQVTVLEREA